MGECLFRQWLKGLNECRLGKVNGLLEHLGSNFSAKTKPLKFCIRDCIM